MFECVDFPSCGSNSIYAKRGKNIRVFEKFLRKSDENLAKRESWEGCEGKFGGVGRGWDY